MQRRKRNTDVNVIASDIVGKAADEVYIVKNPAAVALGRLGGLKSGRVRTERLSSARRVEIAKKAVVARWRRGE